MPGSENMGVGSSARKIDNKRKVTGSAIYGSDLDRNDLLHAAILRSPVPHARVESVNVADVKNKPGVEAVVQRSELMGIFDSCVRHHGDIIAAVAAESKKEANRAINEIDYELTELESVFDPEKAIREESPTVHENNPDYKQDRRHPFTIQNEEYSSNIDDYHTLNVGDINKGFTDADFVYEGEYKSPRVSHCNLDTHCCLAEWDGDTLVLTETLASPGRVQEEFAEFFDMPKENIRIQTPPTASSSFGGRSLKKLSLEPAAATLARRTGRPVKLWFDREEEFIGTATRHATRYTLKTGITSEGKITAIRIECMADTGAYPNGVGHIVLSNSENRPLDLYKIPNYSYEGVSVFTNNIPGGEYRGIGTTQLTFALESHMDEVARNADIDPVKLREQNFVEEGYPRPHTKQPIESCGVRECLIRSRERYSRIYEDEEISNSTSVVRGLGIAAGAHTTASGTSGEADSSEARLTLNSDGSIDASVGSLDHGQGSHTVMAQIISEELSIPVDRVNVKRFPTTSDLTDKQGAVASRSTYIVGSAVRDAAQTLREKLVDIAGERSDNDPQPVEFADGSINFDGRHSLCITDLLDSPIDVVGTAGSELTPPSYGVHLAEVEVDIETGSIDVINYVAAQDIGYAINPSMVEGQLEGAVQHGIEFSLYSNLRLDRGNPENANLADYPVVSPHEMPNHIECELIESNEESGPYGAKGVGTPSMAPIAPAILNAVRDATGYRVRSPPVRDEMLFRAFFD